LALSFLFAISFIVTGVSEIIFALSNKEELDNWGWVLFFGSVSLLMGILMVANPEISMITLPFYVGFLLMFRSIAGISFALDLKNYKVLDWGNLMIIAVLGLFFSFILIWNPLFAGMSIVIWTGLALLFAGCYGVYLALKLKKLKDTPEKITQELKDKLADVQNQIKDYLSK